MTKPISLLFLPLLIGCLAPKKMAIANIVAKNNSSVSGSAIFNEKSGKVKIDVSITGVGAGPVAIHIHETGDCSSDDGKSTGGHWNPTVEDHGKWGEPPFHSGDIGNITIDQYGAGTLSLVDNYGRWTIGGPPETNIINKAIIVHLGDDDMHSQPTGAAGARIGCGVIRIKN